MKQTIAVAALLGHISAVDLLKHHKRQHKQDNMPAIEATWDRGTTGDNMMPATLLQRGDNISGLEIMANGTPEVFPLRGNAKKIEDTWVRGTTNNAMVPASLSSPPASKSDLQLQGDWATYTGPIPATWVRGTTNSSMVTEPPVPKLPQQAPPKAANIQLDGDWSTYSGPMEATWVRGTTNSAMVTEPPVPTLKGKQAPPKAANIQLDGDWSSYNGPMEDTWVRGTTNDAMVPPSLSFPPKPKAAKVAAPAKAAAKSLVPKPEKQIDEVPADKAAIQLSRYDLEQTWVRPTTDDSMVPVSESMPTKVKGPVSRTSKDKIIPQTSSTTGTSTSPDKKFTKPKKTAKNVPAVQDSELTQLKSKQPGNGEDKKKLVPVASTSPEKKEPKQKPVSKKEQAAIDEPLYIQLDKERVPVEDTWVRGTTNSSMVDETPPPKAGDKTAKKAANAAKKADKAAAAAPAKEEAPEKEADIQIQDNQAGFETIANGSAESFELRKTPRTLEQTWERGTTNASMVTEPAPFSKQKDEKEDDRSKEEKAEDAKKAAAAPAKDAAPATDAKVQLGDNESGLEVMANGTAEVFPLRGNPKAITATWERGTTNMVDPDGKVAKIDRKVDNNPDRSRQEWFATRTESREVAAAQHHWEMQSNRDTTASQTKYAKEAFDKIFKNEKIRDAGMKEFLIDPTTTNEKPFAPGFGEQGTPDVVPKDDDKVQLGDNESGLELMANGTPEVFPIRGNPKAITATWERGTTNMVDPDGKVADIARTMVNNPDKSRSSWAQTRAESREVAAAQHHWEMQSNRDTTASQTKYAKEAFDKIFKNEKIRDAGMKEFLIDPTTTNEAPFAKGFGEQDQADKLPKEDKPEAKEDIALYEAPGQADISFQRDTKIARAVAAEQQKQEAEWLNEHKAATAAIQAKTMAKKDRNFIDREGVYQNNWHRPLSSYAQVAAAPRSQADVTFQSGIVEARAVAAEQQKYEADWINAHKASTAATQARTDAKKWKNFQDREEVQYNNWHLRQGQI